MNVKQSLIARPFDAAPFQRVLVVSNLANGDEKVLRLGRRLAHDAGAELTVLAAIDKRDEIKHIARFQNLPLDDVRREVTNGLRQQLEAQVTDLGMQDAATLDVSVGKPFLDIVHRVLEGDYDLVIKPAETIGDGPLSIFASTDQHLLRKCPCPVWLTHAERPKPIRSVLAAVDIDEFAASEPDTMNALNNTILETAAKIALFEGVSLHVLHVWDAPAEGMARLFSGRHDNVGAYVRSVKARHQNALDSLIAEARRKIGAVGFDTLQVAQHLSQGVAREIIPSRVAQLGIDVLVLGTIARTGVPGLIIGNTAEDILNSVTCEVVTVKPPGYISPVLAAKDSSTKGSFE